VANVAPISGVLLVALLVVGKVKVMSLCLTKYHAMKMSPVKMYGEVEV